MGVSVAICTCNGAARLAAPLLALQRQAMLRRVEWEVLLVDNASTDSSTETAAALWTTPGVPFRVIREDRRGLSHARARALAEAAHELVAFVDDDNAPGPDWLERVDALMDEHADVGACGGRVEPVFSSPPPAWFWDYQEDFCAGEQAPRSGDVTDDRGYLWGAGLVVRGAAWAAALDGGFRPRLTDRLGSRVSGGGDVELCLAIRAAGWRLWYDRELLVHHHIPPERVTVEYLKRLRREHGAASLALEALGFPLTAPAGAGRPPHGTARRAGSALRNLARHAAGAWKARGADEPHPSALEAEFLIGRLGALLRGGAATSARELAEGRG